MNGLLKERPDVFGHEDLKTQDVKIGRPPSSRDLGSPYCKTTFECGTSRTCPATPHPIRGSRDGDRAVRPGLINCYGQKLSVTEMQSEAGAAGALHGALKAGAFSTTFTASCFVASEKVCVSAMGGGMGGVAAVQRGFTARRSACECV